MGVDKLV